MTILALALVIMLVNLVFVAFVGFVLHVAIDIFYKDNYNG